MLRTDIDQILDEIDRYEIDIGIEVWVILARIIRRAPTDPFLIPKQPLSTMKFKLWLTAESLRETK